MNLRNTILMQNLKSLLRDIEVYDEYENGKLMFFEGSESVLISIELTDDTSSKIYYYDVKIADSLEEFLIKIQEDDNYYLNTNCVKS